MANTRTTDVEASLAQSLRMIRSGAELVRFTTQGLKEVKSLSTIRKQLRDRGVETPVIADIHFNPALAIEAASVAEKIRINPGNYLKGASVQTLLPPLLEVCQRHETAIRIGVNHGSLDPSIVEEYGDSPAGMVESAMRFLRVCSEHNFHRVVVSMKSSNPRVMVQSVRLLVSRMGQEQMNYPLHLGVTEAGDGLEGRIRSAVGVAPLLLEGMGDTLRVSLTEPPEQEMPVAQEFIRFFPKPTHLPYDPVGMMAWDPFSFNRRQSRSVKGIGSGSKVKLISDSPPEAETDLTSQQLEGWMVTYSQWLQRPSLLNTGGKILLLEQNQQSIQEVKSQLNRFCTQNNVAPVIYKPSLSDRKPDTFNLQLAGELGSLLVDGAIDAVWVENKHLTTAQVNDTLLLILQAAGARSSRADYIACPSCGRTHFDIVKRLREIRSATSHLTSMKIAVMGCIVNGPGEMADAHYGYVGAGKGRVTIYKGKNPVRKNIRESEALEALISLMKDEGDWLEPGS
jgi:(E)-4-hydroxy-3-methylbut-2-enyl-diphosphate synthase